MSGPLREQQLANLREWVETTLNVMVAPDGLVATPDFIDTITQVIECRAQEIAAGLAEARSRGPSLDVDDQDRRQQTEEHQAPARRPCARYLDIWRVGTEWLKTPPGAVCPRCGFSQEEHATSDDHDKAPA